jgi:hypothetical protein
LSRLPILLHNLACLLLFRKGRILRLEETRERTTSNGVPNLRPSRSISLSPNLGPNLNPTWRQVGMLNG